MDGATPGTVAETEYSTARYRLVQRSRFTRDGANGIFCDIIAYYRISDTLQVDDNDLLSLACALIDTIACSRVPIYPDDNPCYETDMAPIQQVCYLVICFTRERCRVTVMIHSCSRQLNVRVCSMPC